MAEAVVSQPLVPAEELSPRTVHPGLQLPDPEKDAAEQGNPPAVRFSSKLQEIEAPQSLESGNSKDDARQPLSPEAEAELKQLASTISRPEASKRSLTNFVFEPVSLPVSRVPSRESARPGTETPTKRLMPGSAAHTPPLTPATSSGREPHQIEESPRPPSSHITPQTSDPSISDAKRPSSASTTGRIGGSFSLGRSTSDSHEGTATPGPGSGTVTPPTQYSRPNMPTGDKDSQYARSQRPLSHMPNKLDAADANFIFNTTRQNNRHSIIGIGGIGGSWSTPSSRNNSTVDMVNHDRRPSGNSTIKQVKEEHKGHSSMADLKRFFRFGHSKKSQSPTRGSTKSTKSSRSSMIISPPNGKIKPSPAPSQVQLPFADDHGLESKYGKFGKVLGSGAGGSVRLMKRSSDGTTFAVKQFRDKHAHETEREYNKKVTAEFCVGSTLHHGNIIETLDIIHENNHWYEVMEYAPFDLFAIVMTGKMSREEVTCCFLQIFAGVTYLHGMGLAHRDLKLDNVVVNEHGIMKIIDFGSATVFRYPFETDIVLASGIVGSDPYLAPEVYDGAKYDPQPTDIWSLAIIFACMTLRRFPWKVPRVTDNSYRLFILPPDPNTPGDPSRSQSTSAPDTAPASTDDTSSKSSHHHHHHHKHTTDPKSSITTTSTAKAEVIKGPWRLLRLLPRESRTIIGKMLEIDPKKRATIDEMLQDPWISNSPVCQQIDGQIVRAEGHTHVLEPGSADQGSDAKKK